MTIFVLYISFLYLLEMVLARLRWNWKKTFVVCSSIFLFVIIGFRDYQIGVDTYGYMLSFNEFSYLYSLSWKSILEIFSVKKEPLYVLFNLIISAFSDDFTVVLCGYALLYTIAVGVLVYRFSANPRWSYIVLLSLGFLYFAMAGIRQTMAMAILLFSYKYIKERRLLPFLLLVFLAYFFHNTAVVFLLAYPISTLKVNWKHLMALVTVYIVMAYFSGFVRFVLFDLLNWDRLSSYENRTVTLSFSGALIQIAIFAFAYLFRKDAEKNNRDNQILINLSFIGCAFQLFSSVIAEFFRISMYFSIFNILMIPNVTYAIRIKSNKRIVYLVIPLLLLTYYFFFSGSDPSIVPYHFVF